MASIIPGDVRITSRWQVWFRLQAVDAEAAVAKVEGTYLPALVAAVQMVNDQMISVRMTRVGAVDDRGWIAEPHSPWGWSSFVYGYMAESLDPAETEEVARHTLIAQNDSTGLAAARQYSAARRLHDLSAGLEPFKEAALLAYFKVLEVIARQVTPARQVDYSEVETILQDLEKKLIGRRSTKNKAGALQQASKDITRLEFGHTGDQILGAGRALGLEKDVLQRVERLRKLRNTRLGHTGTGDGVMVEPEFGEDLARRYLSAYLRRTARLRAEIGSGGGDDQ